MPTDVIPGGHLTRSKKVFGRRLSRAYDAYVVDEHGNTLIDMLCALGARSLSNTNQFGLVGGVYSLSDPVEILAAAAIQKHVAPWATHVRFVKTGSEATHAAYRIAKAATGRSHAMVWQGAYHGWHEWPEKSVKYENGKAIAYTRLSPEDPSIAAVFYEPPRFTPVDVAYLRWLREYCDSTGALLVFDEMIFGGRVALGGATEYYGVIPDLACFGKAIANGQSAACVVGRNALADHGELVSGTYSGDTIGLQAVCDTLHTYATEPVIETLWTRGRQLAEGLDLLVKKYPGLAVREGLPVHQRLRFLNPDHGERFMHGMMLRGVLWHPGCANVMYAHTPEQIDAVLRAADVTCHTLL
jgi:glutamate-1-semialdehyde 2,1-aminomutase